MFHSFGDRFFEYNSNNQIIRVSDRGDRKGEYFYSNEGKRYKKVENYKVSFYIYGGERLLYEKTEGTTDIYYIYLNGRTVAKVELNDNSTST